MVTDSMRCVTTGGTPLDDEEGLPAALMVLTALKPLTTWPKSEYLGGSASPEDPRSTASTAGSPLSRSLFPGSHMRRQV